MSRIDTGYINQEMISMIAGHIRDAGLHIAVTRPALNVVRIDAMRGPFDLEAPVGRVTLSFQDQQTVHVRLEALHPKLRILTRITADTTFADTTFTDTRDMVHGHKISKLVEPLLDDLLIPA